MIGRMKHKEALSIHVNGYSLIVPLTIKGVETADKFIDALKEIFVK